ncbi:TonB-dependent receptor [Formosa sediminum]|uniref:TonB-dependent receptor n=1 Tax=Formosa sediminum TaxID=2594004 RepID=A0A516GN95_9FLAO|nr:TonB-dependent receptor [Formosa sediminum]QDO93006.1 TonB-dependent receptor [Formosa sediminum]
MERLLQFKSLVFLICFGVSNIIAAQEVMGTVSDHSGAMPGVSVIIKGTSVGTTTDFDGKYSLSVEPGEILVFSYVGYETKEVVVSGEVIDVVLEAGVALDAIVLLGNRAKPRTLLDSPVPIDNIGVDELTGGGQPTIESMLTFKVPSFNAQTQAIADATAHYDPADLRGLGPSRTLVLINGKRKNQSAQVYLNRTPGKGEVGVDLKSIPTAAIESVEILRDGASAQYGSDAIAGVINMVLKKDAQFSSFSVKSGLTTDGDGFNFATDFNTTLGFGEGGSINLTLGYYNQSHTNRAGVVDPDAEGATRDYEIEWLANNPKAGMTVGQPDLEKGDLFVNISHPVGKSSEFYSFNGYTLRTGKSFAYYRAPYWRQDVADAELLTPTEDFEGYQPTFEARIKDHINSMGLKMDLGNNWFGDASVTYGRNSVSYTVNNSVNRDYLADHGTSPTTFEPGGYSLSNIIGNLDFSSVFTEMISASFGMEYKIEYFEAIEGEPLSYYGEGSDSFAGIKPEEAGKWDRNNLGIYAGLDFDITDALLLGVAGRYEDFSDFGDNFSWKIFGRQKLGSNGVIRASYSTGFRAPTLHQRFLTNSQYIIVEGSSEPLLQGTLANNNPAVEALGVSNLFAETSKNIAAGITYKFKSNFYASLDFYQINVDDRILFSSQIGSDSDDTTINPVEQILIDNGVTAVQFFINAGDTKTTGLDFVLNYDNIELGTALLNVNLAANFNKTTIDAINTPDALAANGYDIFERIERGLITNSRPKSKVILGLDYEADKFGIGLYNTMFGEVTITSPLGKEFDQDLSSKVATDISVSYHFTDMLSLTGVINNIFDVYPDETLASTGTAQAASRFTYSSEVQQLGQLGTNFSVGLNYRF